MKHQGTKNIETERLLLRRFELADARAMFENWTGDGEVTRFLCWPAHKSIEETEKILATWIESYEKPVYYNWAITLRGEPENPVGSISIVQLEEELGMVQVGYCLGRGYWGRGIMPEALAGLIGFFFREAGANRVEARHDPRNPNSGKVMRKCGMRYEGTRRQADRNNQGICDVSYYAVLAGDAAARRYR